MQNQFIREPRSLLDKIFIIRAVMIGGKNLAWVNGKDIDIAAKTEIDQAVNCFKRYANVVSAYIREF
jgi:hypothetical protein